LVCSIWLVKPPALPTAWATSTITPWMLLLLISRKVNGEPLAVAPTLYEGALSACTAVTHSAAQKPKARRRNKGERLFIGLLQKENGSSVPQAAGDETASSVPFRLSKSNIAIKPTK
jgi:hypothetical protein